MKRLLAILAAVALGAPALAQQPQTTPQPLITTPPIEVTSEDVDAFILRIPAEYRTEVRASMERIGKIVDQVYANRVMAAEARKLGLDKDPAARKRIEQLEESFLATLWRERYRETVKVPDLSARAEEMYRVNRAKFTEPDRLMGQFLFIANSGRTRDAAAAYAKDLHAKAQGGADFGGLVMSFSEDPNVRRTQGRLRAVTRDDLEKPIADAAFALKAKGDLTAPIETPAGFTIVRLDSRMAGGVKPYSEVKEDLIAEQEQQYRDQETDQQVGRLKNTPQTVVHTKNIEALRKELSAEDISRMHDKGAKKSRPAPAKGAEPR